MPLGMSFIFVSYGLEKTFGYPPNPPLGRCLHFSPRGVVCQLRFTETSRYVLLKGVAILQTWKLVDWLKAWCENSHDCNDCTVVQQDATMRRLHPQRVQKVVVSFHHSSVQRYVSFSGSVACHVTVMWFQCLMVFCLVCEWFSLCVSRDAILRSPLYVTRSTA